jgi:hypothetical protein
MSMQMTKNAKSLAFHGMAAAQNGYRGWKVADVGSVS